MWILLTFIAVFLYSLVNITDNYLVEKNKNVSRSIGALVLFSSLFALVAAGVIYLVGGKNFALSARDILILLVAGFCNLVWLMFYFKALAVDDVSSVIPWFLTLPLFGYILGYFFLGETITYIQMIGGAIVVLGGVVLSIRTEKSAVSIRYHVKWRSVLYMLFASLFIAIWIVLFKFVGRDSGFWAATFWEHLGLGIAGIVVLVLIKKYREAFFSMVRTSGKKILLVNIASESTTIIGNLLVNYAILSVPIVLVLVIEVAQPLIVFLLGIVCTIFFPRILTEDISKRSLIHKGISLCIMITGALFLI